MKEAIPLSGVSGVQPDDAKCTREIGDRPLSWTNQRDTKRLRCWQIIKEHTPKMYQRSYDLLRPGTDEEARSLQRANRIEEAKASSPRSCIIMSKGLLINQTRRHHTCVLAELLWELERPGPRSQTVARGTAPIPAPRENRFYWRWQREAKQTQQGGGHV